MKANIVLSILMACFVISLASCSSEHDGTLSSFPDVNDVMNERHISMDQAKKRLGQIITNRAFSSDSQQKTFKAINNGVAYGEDGEILTRNNENQALYYVFDIGTEGEYAIMGASTQLPELIVYSQGDNNSGDDSQNYGNYASYLSSLRDSLTINLPLISTDPIEADPTEIIY